MELNPHKPDPHDIHIHLPEVSERKLLRVLFILWAIAILILLGVIASKAQVGPVSTNVTQPDGTKLHVTCDTGCSTSAGFVDNSAFTFGTTSVNTISGVYNTVVTNLTSGSAGAIQATTDRMLYVNLGKIGGIVPGLTGSSLNVNCTGGCGASTFADNAAFTAGTSAVTITAGWYSAAPTACTSGSACAPSLTSDRKLFVQAFQGTSPWSVTFPSAQAVTASESGTWTVQPGNTANTTAWLVTGAGGTFPVTGTITANAGTNLNTSLLQLDSTGAKLNLTQASTTLGQTGPLVQGAVTTSAPAYTTSQTSPLSLTTTGALRTDASATTQPVSGTVTANQGTPANWAVNEAQIGGSNVVADPCQQLARTHFNINQAAGAQLITGAAAKQTYLCDLDLITATAQNIALVEGTGTVCATGTAGMDGGATAATGWNLAANGGLVKGVGRYWVFRTATAADNVCLLQSGTGQISGGGDYVQQ